MGKTKIKDSKHGVYMHIFPNGKMYIGKFHGKPEDRWGKNGERYKEQIVYNAILKYGWENVEHKIIQSNMTEEDALELERKLIKLYQTNGFANNFKYGYNMTDGGDGLCKKVVCDSIIYDSIYECAEYYNVNPSTMTKWCNGINTIPQKFLDLKLHYLGEEQNKIVQYSQDKRKIKIICTTINKQFDSMIECIKYIKENYDVELKQNHISAILEGRYYATQGFHFIYANKENNEYVYKGSQWAKKVCMLDKNTNELINIFDNMRQATNYFNPNAKNISGISGCIHHRHNTAYGYKWMLYDEYISLQKEDI